MCVQEFGWYSGLPRWFLPDTHIHTYMHTKIHTHIYKISYSIIKRLTYQPFQPTISYTHIPPTPHITPTPFPIIISGYVPHSTCSCFFHAYPKHETPRTETLTDKETVVYVFLNKGHGFLRLLSNLISSELSLKVRYQFGL